MIFVCRTMFVDINIMFKVYVFILYLMLFSKLLSWLFYILITAETFLVMNLHQTARYFSISLSWLCYFTPLIMSLMKRCNSFCFYSCNNKTWTKHDRWNSTVLTLAEILSYVYNHTKTIRYIKVLLELSCLCLHSHNLLNSSWITLLAFWKVEMKCKSQWNRT